MANELFTNRFGKQVPLKTYTVEPSMMVTIMRLQEDFQQRGEHLSIHGVMVHVIDKGIIQTRNYWKNLDRNKAQKQFAKEVTKYMANPTKFAKEIKEAAERHGLIEGTPVDLSDEVEELELEGSEEDQTVPE